MNKKFLSPNKSSDKIWQNIPVVSVLTFFCIIYCLISLVNHYLFRTASLDLGMNTQALHCFSRFTMNNFSLAIRDSQVLYFADHFSPITMLYVPFYYILGSYTLLVIQIAAVLFGGLGIYQYAKTFCNYKYLPVLFLIHFLSIWGIYSALSFDFHNNVVAAMFVPWLIYHYRKNEKSKFLAYFLLILIAKENMALWLVFIILGLGLFNLKTKGLKGLLKFEIPLILFASLYFLIIVGFVMPFLRQGSGYDQLQRYYHLGHSISEIFETFLKRPLYVLSLFFSDPANGASVSEIKMELHIMVLLSGGLAIFYRPYFFVMLIPIYAQKMLSNNPVLWGLNSQYSIEFVPIISIALIVACEKINNKKIPLILTWIILITTIVSTVAKIDHRKSKWYNKTNTAFYMGKHYNTELNLKEIYKQIHTLPTDAVLSVSTSLSPHLANRKKIYNFPHVRDAEYIVVFSDKMPTYPISRDEFNKKIEKYRNSPNWKIMYNNNFLLILKHKNN